MRIQEIDKLKKRYFDWKSQEPHKKAISLEKGTLIHLDNSSGYDRLPVKQDRPTWD